MTLETSDQKKVEEVVQPDIDDEENPAPKERLNNLFTIGDLIKNDSGYQIVVDTMSVPPGEITLSGQQRVLCLNQRGQVSSWVSADNFSLTEDPEKRNVFLLFLAEYWGVEVEGLSNKWAEIARARYYVDTHPFG